MLPLGWGKVGKSEWHFQERLDYLLALYDRVWVWVEKTGICSERSLLDNPGNVSNFTVGLLEPRTRMPVLQMGIMKTVTLNDTHCHFFLSD